jgi:DNA-binding NarL/FixJ family response regulator
MSIRVLLADDHAMMRQGLRVLLDRELDIEVVGEAADGREAAELAEQLQPDVAVLDIGMPRLNGVDAARRIARCARGARVIALSVHREKRFILEMLRADARGYLLKSGAAEELIEAVRAVHAGRTYLSSRIAATVVDGYLNRAAGGEIDDCPAGGLSDRERQVLQLLAEGLSSKQMAKQLGVSVKTIVTHRQNIMNKLEIRTIAELTKFALREGLTSLEV